jgi:hypothetical protein
MVPFVAHQLDVSDVMGCWGRKNKNINPVQRPVMSSHSVCGLSCSFVVSYNIIANTKQMLYTICYYAWDNR